MQCPVCRTTDIHELATTCPHCRTDLTAFVVLDTAEEDFVSMAKRRVELEGDITSLKIEYQEELRQYKSLINKMWLLLLLLPLLHLLFYNG